VGIGAGGFGIVNLGGGVVTAPILQGGAGTSYLNFHGGTIKPTTSTATFVQGFTGAYVYGDGGAVVDTGAHNVTIAQSLLAPTDSGVTAIAVGNGGSGYEDTPLVTLSGGSGTGATAVANVSGGVVTGFTITNPGTGYLPGEELTVAIEGGGSGTGATAGVVTLGANASGGLTKTGGGALTLSGASTYTGATSVSAGTLLVTGSLGNTAVTVSSGATLGGTGTIAGGVTPAVGGILSPGLANAVGTLTVGSLTLQDGVIIDQHFGLATNDEITVTQPGGLTINGGGYNLYQAGGITPFSTNGVYNLIGYTGTFAGDAANLDVLNGQVGKTYAFGANGTHIILTISNADVTPNYWNIDADGNWTTAANWTLAEAPNAPAAFASFGGGGTPITAPRTVTLDAGQTVGTLAFNSDNSFTIAGANTLTLDNDGEAAQITDADGSHTVGVDLAIAGSLAAQVNVVGALDTLTLSGAISGSAGIQKLGTGTLVLSGANTYTGANAVNNGTLQLSGAGTLGAATNTLTVTNSATVDLGGSSQSTGALTLTDGVIRNGTLQSTSYTVTGGGNSTISAVMAGGGGLTVNKTGGVLVLTGNQTFTGGTGITQGHLQLGDGTTDGTVLGGILNNGLLTFNVAGTTTNNSLIAGTGEVVKSGPGQLTLAGTSTYTGATSVTGGTLVVTGVINSLNATNGWVSVSGAGGGTSTLEVDGGTINARRVDLGLLVGTNGGDGVVNLNSGTIGTTIAWFGDNDAASSGMLNMSGGTFTSSGDVLVGRNRGTGAITISGGVMNVGGVLHLGDGTAPGSPTSGTVTVSGGTLNSIGDIIVGGSGNGTTGTFTVSGGTVNLGTTGKRWMIVGLWDTASGTVNISSGSLNLNNNTDMRFATQFNSTGPNVVNQDGGSVTFYADNGTTTAGSVGVIDMQYDGTTSSSTTYNLNGGTLTVAQIITSSVEAERGNRVFNFNGGTISPTGAVTNFLGAGSVSRANVRDGGARINTNGFDITIAQALEHSDVGGDAEVDGGLIKLGAGTLTLSGMNSYTGATAVNAGGLVLSGSLTASASLSVASGATLELQNALSLHDAIVLSLVDGASLAMSYAIGESETIGALLLNGVSIDPGTYTAAELDALPSATGITFSGNGSLTVVPEPSTWGLMILGVAAGAFTIVRRRRAAFSKLSSGR
jgi:autotransporter-associated beta strand protein